MTPEELDRLERLCAATTHDTAHYGEAQVMLRTGAVKALPDLIAEVRRLKTEREADRKTFHDNQWRQLQDAHIEVGELEAEVERLREALNDIDAMVHNGRPPLHIRTTIARALAPIPPGQEGEGK